MLASLLASGKVLLADGATGKNLFAMGLTSGDAPEMWNFDYPERVKALHQGFVDAGADIILTNSFGGNARRLMLHGMQDKAREINRLAAQLARSVADKAGRQVVVAGSVGPTGDLFAPLGPLTEDEAVEVFVDQMEGLKEGGADVAWIETMSSIEEIRAAARAAAREMRRARSIGLVDKVSRDPFRGKPALAGSGHRGPTPLPPPLPAGEQRRGLRGRNRQRYLGR